MSLRHFKKNSLFSGIFFLIVFSLLALLDFSPELKGFETLVSLFIAFFTLYIVVDVLANIIATSYRGFYSLPREHFDNFTIGVTTASVLIKTASLFFLAFYFFEIDIQFFLTSLGLFSVALAWLLKDYVNNIIDGLIILFSENLKIKDYIIVDDYKGVINHITLLETELRTDEGDIVHIPNTLLLEKPVVNFSRGRVKTINYSFELEKKYFSKIEKLEKFLKDCIPDNFPEVMTRERFYFKIDEIKSDRMSISLQIPVGKYNFDLEEKIKKFISLKILAFIK